MQQMFARLDVFLQLAAAAGRDILSALLCSEHGRRDDRRTRPPIALLRHRHVHAVDHVPYPFSLRKQIKTHLMEQPKEGTPQAIMMSLSILYH